MHYVKNDNMTINFKKAIAKPLLASEAEPYVLKSSGTRPWIFKKLDSSTKPYFFKSISIFIILTCKKATEGANT